MVAWKQKRQHLCHYNRIAHIYNTRYREEQNLKIRTALERFEHKKQDVILDLGCGTGLLIPEIRKKARVIVGLDISKNMLKEALLLAKRSANIHLVIADADYTPFPDSCFDTIYAFTLLQNMPNPKKTLQEIHHITKPNAAMIVAGLKKQFAGETFLSLLKTSGLSGRLVKTDDSLKCHIAVCRKC